MFQEKDVKVVVVHLWTMNSLFSYLSRRTHSNVLYKVSVWMRLFVSQVKKVQDVVKKKAGRMLHVVKCLLEEDW